ncbi:hypothetical protein HGRIS_007592 [Hohenbuehelia grisea]|uniref:Aminoglycoside phosphotransferase domain-containing protein n=1 Tax=Hohenbuehelia grisea TaxID=104357 RepID=A0ABR3J6Q3_9AGAR
MSSSASSSASLDSTEEFISSLDLGIIERLALTVRREVSGGGQVLPSALSCVVDSPPKSGSYNVVYRLCFSDGLQWAIRIPLRQWNITHARSMRLDIVAQEYILAHTSIPIPRIHSHSCNLDNALGHPYIITDYAEGTRLVDVWNDPSWWEGDRTKERTLSSFAKHMVELSMLEFAEIGRLECVESDGSHVVSPFPSLLALNEALTGPDRELGPFDNIQAYLGTLIAERRRQNDTPMLVLLSVLLKILTEGPYESAPFHLCHPDCDSQNIFVDDTTGEISAIIDWDGVAVVPRQLGALSYPSWITVDWDPLMYQIYEDQPHCDTEDDLHAFRTMYFNAINALSPERAAVTRNSHIAGALAIATLAEYTTANIVYKLGELAFGSKVLAYEIMQGIETGLWFNANP